MVVCEAAVGVRTQRCAAVLPRRKRGGYSFARGRKCRNEAAHRVAYEPVSTALTPRLPRPHPSVASAAEAPAQGSDLTFPPLAMLSLLPALSSPMHSMCSKSICSRR